MDWYSLESQLWITAQLWVTLVSHSYCELQYLTLVRVAIANRSNIEWELQIASRLTKMWFKLSSLVNFWVLSIDIQCRSPPRIPCRLWSWQSRGSPRRRFSARRWCGAFWSSPTAPTSGVAAGVSNWVYVFIIIMNKFRDIWGDLLAIDFSGCLLFNRIFVF